MRKTVFGLLLLLGMVPVSKAQDNVSFGPTAGFGHTWMSNMDNAVYQPAGNIGVRLIYSSNEHLGFGGGLKWSIEGGRAKSGNTEVTTRIDYLRVPLEVMYFFGNFGDQLRPKISLGPTFGFLVGGKRTIETNGTTLSETKAGDLYNSFDAGLQASAGLNYRLVRNTWLTTDISYYNGLMDINDPKTATKNNNRNLSLNLGLTFGIGRAE